MDDLAFKIRGLKKLRDEYINAVQNLTKAIKSEMDYNQNYGHGQMEKDYLEVMNNLKIQYATEEVFK